MRVCAYERNYISFLDLCLLAWIDIVFFDNKTGIIMP